MKNLLLMLFAISMFAVGCSRDDDNAPQDLLQGSWKPQKWVEKYTIDSGSTDVTTETATSCQQQSRITFGENGNGTYVEFSENNGACTQVDSSNFTFNYNPDTKKITINEGNSNITQDVNTLTSSSLILIDTESFTMNGQTHTYVYETHMEKVK